MNSDLIFRGWKRRRYPNEINIGMLGPYDLRSLQQRPTAFPVDELTNGKEHESFLTDATLLSLYRTIESGVASMIYLRRMDAGVSNFKVVRNAVSK